MCQGATLQQKIHEVLQMYLCTFYKYIYSTFCFYDISIIQADIRDGFHGELMLPSQGQPHLSTDTVIEFQKIYRLLNCVLRIIAFINGNTHQFNVFWFCFDTIHFAGTLLQIICWPSEVVTWWEATAKPSRLTSPCSVTNVFIYLANILF